MEYDIESILQRALQVRYFEERLLEEYKKGQIHGTVHTCIGQEVFPCILSEYTKDYHWFSNHRGHGHYLAKTRDFKGLAAEILLKEGAVAGGIGGSQHLKNENFMSNGIQGGQTGIAVGYSSQVQNSLNYKSVMFLGDGTLGAGHIYEAFNLGLLHDSKIIYVLEDNKIAQSTPTEKTFFGDIYKIVSGYGMSYFKCNSDNIDSMISAINSAIQESKPCFIHLETKRLSSHSKGDDNRDDKFIETLFVDDILHNKLSENALSYDDDYIVEIKNLFDEVIKSPDSFYEETEQDADTFVDNVEIVKTGQKFIEHINESLRDFLTKNESSVLIGEDIEDDPFMSGKVYGGAFKATKGLSTLFPKRVLNMPISESGFTGFAAGIALRGQYTIVEIMFADFLSQNFDQIFHQIAKIPSIYGAKTDLPIFIRTAGFSGNGYGPTHSESMENIYFGLPNLDIYVPNVFSSYENILNEFEYRKKPTLVIEPKALYNNKVNDKIYSEYSLTNDNFITQLKPKTRKPSVTILTMGPQLDLLVSNLEYLAKEYEIYVNIFSPIKMNNIDTGTLETSVGESGNNIIAFSNSLGYSSIFDHWISELLKVTKINNYKSTKMRNWIPTSKSEKNILPNMEELINIIESINE